MAKSKAEKNELLKRLTGRMPWYAQSGGEAAKLVFQRVNSLRTTELATYRSQVLRNMRLYAGSLNVNGITADLPEFKTRYNIIKEMVDTGVAVICAARTLPYAQPRGADWTKRRKCAKFNRTLQQQFNSIGVFNESQSVIRDAVIGGLGTLKFFPDPTKPGGTVGCERRIPLSGVWDPTEAADGNLTQYFDIRLVNRDQLVSLYPNKYDKIVAAAAPSALDIQDFQLKYGGARSNQVVVIEAWKLPASVNDDGEAQGGRHGVYVSTGELYEEDWCSPRLPFAFMHGWYPKQLGFVGTSITEIVEPAQYLIESHQDFTEACQKLGSKPQAWIKRGSKVEPEQITNEGMSLNLYDGDQPPTFFTFDATPHDLESAVQIIREQVRSMLGFSELQTSGSKPDGLNSGAALGAMEDIQSKRHVVNIRWVEQYYLDCGWALIDANNQLAEDEPGFFIDSESRGEWLETSAWKEIRLDEDDARIAVLPMAAMMGSPSAFYQRLAEWEQQGRVSSQTAALLESMPDVEGQAEDDTVDIRYADFLCEQIEDSKRVFVDPYADATQLTPHIRERYLAAVLAEADEPVLDEYRRVLDVLKSKQDAVAAASAPPPMDPMGGGAPPAMMGADPAAGMGGALPAPMMA